MIPVPRNVLAPVVTDSVLSLRVGHAFFGGLALNLVAAPGKLVDQRLRRPGDLETVAFLLGGVAQCVQAVRQARVERRLKIGRVALQVPELARLPAPPPLRPP